MDSPDRQWGPYHSVQLEQRYQQLRALGRDAIQQLGYNDAVPFLRSWNHTLAEINDLAEDDHSVNNQYELMFDHLEQSIRNVMSNPPPYDHQSTRVDLIYNLMTDLSAARTESDKRDAVSQYYQNIHRIEGAEDRTDDEETVTPVGSDMEEDDDDDDEFRFDANQPRDLDFSSDDDEGGFTLGGPVDMEV